VEILGQTCGGVIPEEKHKEFLSHLEKTQTRRPLE
jgi:hypothetical protein